MWTDTESHLDFHRLWKRVDFLLKVLGTTGRWRTDAVHRPGYKTRGYPVDNRWTAVDNLLRTRRLWIQTRVYTLVSHMRTTGG
ncbi:hypothetical protein C8E87_3161 [Paractinoplanes brasiliensis]|uniref:Uncharacterized protein n=1 Tax=Paractinoplanes brasiliensis TaxID=52695 RepID=A0A4R6JV90_9ACTN|nr:hypothetical protein C8E87_3161 [Actinoplanes brasiliensis]